jgi:hypothetical protein
MALEQQVPLKTVLEEARLQAMASGFRTGTW